MIQQEELDNIQNYTKVSGNVHATYVTVMLRNKVM